jgi:hypothetical protein
MTTGRVVRKQFVNGREFHVVRWHDPDVKIGLGANAVIVAWAVNRHKGPGVFTGKFMGRREV